MCYEILCLILSILQDAAEIMTNENISEKLELVSSSYKVISVHAQKCKQISWHYHFKGHEISSDSAHVFKEWIFWGAHYVQFLTPSFK